MIQWMRQTLLRKRCEFDVVHGWFKATGLPYVRDVVLPDAEGSVLIIPHLMLTPDGLCIFELQCMNGVLHGSEHSLRWSRFERGGRHDFDNPLLHVRGREAHLRRLARLDRLGLPSRSYLVILGDVNFYKAWPGSVANADALRTMLRGWQGRPIPLRALTAWRVFLSMFVHEPVNTFGQSGEG